MPSHGAESAEFGEINGNWSRIRGPTIDFERRIQAETSEFTFELLISGDEFLVVLVRERPRRGEVRIQYLALLSGMIVPKKRCCRLPRFQHREDVGGSISSDCQSAPRPRTPPDAHGPSRPGCPKPTAGAAARQAFRRGDPRPKSFDFSGRAGHMSRISTGRTALPRSLNGVNSPRASVGVEIERSNPKS